MKGKSTPRKPARAATCSGSDQPGLPLTALVRRRLEAIETESGRTYAQLVVDGWLGSAMQGSVPALKELLDRTEGKVADKVQVDDVCKAYVTESPNSLWPSDSSSDPTNPSAPPASSGETCAPSSSSAAPPEPARAARASR